MVVAVFMAAVLVGALWYVIGVGDAILYRQRTQDAADVVAFTGAVVHARGMNLIALVNVVMAAVVAVLAALRLAELLNLAAMVLSCSISSTCSVGVGCWAAPICAYTTELQPELASAARRYEQGFVGSVVPALSSAQAGIARAMPFWAEARAALVAERLGEPVRATVLLSPSLVVPDDSSRMGLPVERGDYATLCARAAEDIVELAFEPFPFGDWLASVTGSMASTFPAHFCGSDDRPSVADQAAAVDEQCAVRREAHERESDAEFDVEQCRDDVRAELERAFAAGARDFDAGLGDLASPLPCRVLSDARNGNDYFQLWGISVSDPKALRRGEVGVRVAGAGRDARSASDNWGRVGLAQAEFFYDTGRGWDDVREDALYGLAWRARLRRVRIPQGHVGGLLRTALALVPSSLSDAFASEPPGCLLVRGEDCLTDQSLRWSAHGRLDVSPEIIH